MKLLNKIDRLTTTRLPMLCRCFALITLLICAGCISMDQLAQAPGQGLYDYYSNRLKNAPLRTPFFKQTLDESSLPGWTLTQNRKGDYVAVRSVPGWDWKLPLLTESAQPWLLSWQPSQENPKVGLLIYYAGTVGGMGQVAVYRAVVVNERRGKALSPALPLRSENEWGRAESEPPTWMWTEKKLIVCNRSERLEIKLP